MPEDRPKDKCGVFGIMGHPEASTMAYLGLYALQHRGQEGAGLVVSDGKEMRVHKGTALVGEVFDEEILARLPGNLAVGHVRYSTTGCSELKNVQPFVGKTRYGDVAVAHNGDLLNAGVIEQDLTRDRGTVFTSTSDSETVLHLIAHSREKNFVDAVVEALVQLKGAYSMLICSKDVLIGVRDPMGFRPLSVAKLDGSYVAASETCAFDLVQAETIREIEPGEMVIITKDGMEFRQALEPKRKALCIFELIYFARPDSHMFGDSVHNFRVALGRQLAREAPAEADVVVPVPDSANAAASGYSQESGIPFEPGIIRNHYVGRTFIEPEQSIRDFGARVKYNAAKGSIEGKRVVVLDDSIVRGTSARKIVRMLRNAGATKVHFRVSSPPIRHVCYYGIDIATKGSLQAHEKSLEEIRQIIDADSLQYISHEGMLKTGTQSDLSYCAACFDGKYPIEPKEPILYHLDPRRQEPAPQRSG